MSQNTFLIVLMLIVVGFFIIKRNFGVAAKLKISPSEAKKRLEDEKGIILLDVRSKEEYLEKHIANSTLIPVDVLQNEAGRKLSDKNAEIFVYCRSGSRSATAVNLLVKLGYTNVRNLGGIMIWPYETVSGRR